VNYIWAFYAAQKSAASARREIAHLSSKRARAKPWFLDEIFPVRDAQQGIQSLFRLTGQNRLKSIRTTSTKCLLNRLVQKRLQFLVGFPQIFGSSGWRTACFAKVGMRFNAQTEQARAIGNCKGGSFGNEEKSGNRARKASFFRKWQFRLQ
jgi:hypothetical protein